MILRAEEKAAELPHTSRPQFQQLDMRQLHTAFSPEAMDGVICLGNTLVHLTETTEIETVISHMQRIIKRNGFCFIQIIHYDYILDSGIEELPTIENEHIRFERQYHYDQDHHLITFMTQLTAKEQREVLENSVLLYPLRKHELQDMLEKTGYINIRFFGDFTGSPLAETSLALIAVAQIP
jgi:ubiquinone/menaquinone biosynthesis C-methylase UbiE